MKMVICFGPEKAALESLGYIPTPIERYGTNRCIYKASVDLDSIPQSLRDALFEGVLVSATRVEITRLQESGISPLFKAEQDDLAIFLKPLADVIPDQLIPYTNFDAGFRRTLRSQERKASQDRVEQHPLGGQISAAQRQIETDNRT